MGPATTTRLIEVGVVTKPHGVRGAVKVRLHNPDSDALDAPEALVVVAPGASDADASDATPDEQLAIERVLGTSGGATIVLVQGCASMDDAEALRGARLLRRRDAISLDDDEFLYADLVGCEVREGERLLGAVSRVFSAGASDVLVVRGEDGERMIPLVSDWVVSVDTAARAIEVTGADAFDVVA